MTAGLQVVYPTTSPTAPAYISRALGASITTMHVSIDVNATALDTGAATPTIFSATGPTNAQVFALQLRTLGGVKQVRTTMTRNGGGVTIGAWVPLLHADASGAKPAVTHFKVIRGYARAGVPATLIECRLETGRTHQIRVHMQHVGHPLVGDQTYGHAPHRGWFHRQALHARRLAIEHPVSGAHLAWQAPLPADMNDLLKSLEKMG